MERPATDPFRDAAMEADASVFSAHDETADRSEPKYASERRPDLVVSDTGIVAHAETHFERHRFSLGATFLGWSVAAFFTVVFVAILGAILGGTVATEPDVINSGYLAVITAGGLVAYLAATFFAYMIGGYAAGRIALWDGVKHGSLIVGWAILFGVVAILLSLTGVANLLVQTSVPIDVRAVTGASIFALVVTLAVMLLGAAWGGRIGERYHERVHGRTPRRAYRARTRGRPG